MAKAKKEDVLDYLESASMLEVSELISDIEEKFGVSVSKRTLERFYKDSAVRFKSVK